MYDSTSLRDLIGKSLAKLDDKRVVVLDGDISKSTKSSDFKAVKPDQFIECGISEISTMSMAYGLAMEGMIPFVTNFCLFTVCSAWTQLRMACYAEANVKIIGSHPGIDNGQDGASHHANEDIALARALPNLKILDPSTPEQLEESIKLAYKTDGPVYIRVPRDKVYCYESGKVRFGVEDIVYDKGNDFAIIFEGSASRAAFDAVEILKGKGLFGKLINAVSLKPFDKSLVIDLLEEVPVIVTAENHSVIGGLYSIVAEVAASVRHNSVVVPVAINDTFSCSGTADELKSHFGITADNVAEKVLQGRVL